MMENEFSPIRRKGIVLMGGVILVLLLSGGYFFLRATQDPSGLGFLLNMLIALLVLLPLPILIYRFYALANAIYILNRDGLMIRWGLRREIISLYQIEWIRPANELGFRLPLPWFRFPGGILGNRKVSELGVVEFIAADLKHLILVATPEKVYAISPADTNTFMKRFRQVSELGSLTPFEAQSVYPKVLLGKVWEDRISRILILSGLAIGLILLIVVSIAVPGLGSIEWLSPETNAPAERLLLLPILDGLIWMFNLILGIFLSRRGERYQLAAYLLWGVSSVSGLLLMMASLLLIF
jgi:hypothetical protein